MFLILGLRKVGLQRSYRIHAIILQERIDTTILQTTCRHLPATSHFHCYDTCTMPYKANLKALVVARSSILYLVLVGNSARFEFTGSYTLLLSSDFFMRSCMHCMYASPLPQDPDAPTRQGRHLSELDAKDELSLVKHLFACIRAGQLSKVKLHVLHLYTASRNVCICCQRSTLSRWMSSECY